MKQIKSWTFEDPKIAKTFDEHVREQLPWYDMVSDAVAYIIRNYLPRGGGVVDIGASTGNLIDKIIPLLIERKSYAVAIEKSEDMAKIMEEKYIKYPHDVITVLNHDIVEIEMTMPKAEVYVLFLTMMFIPVNKRQALIKTIRNSCTKGGVIIVVDKICDHGGYFATVLKRLGMWWKIQQGAELGAVTTKEMSLAGVQIPINPNLLGSDAKLFFRMGEFAGWVIET